MAGKPASEKQAADGSHAASSEQPRVHVLMWREDLAAWPFHVALVLLQLAPLVCHVNTNFNIIATASLTVFCGSWRSVKAAPPTETMTKGDAMRFPLVGSAVLLGLFLLFKVLPKELVNTLLTAYLGLVATFVLTSVLVPYLSYLFPETLRHKELELPHWKIPYVVDNSDGSVAPTVPEVAVGAISACFCAWYYMKRHWLANNTLGLSFSLAGIEHLSLGSMHVGTILLAGLFVYDIFWVFCTPVMVSVAKNFDAPIKLLFPRLGVDVSGKRPFAMLGLGDIVIPGIVVALLLRYDAAHNFKSKYFQSAFGGYVLGLGTTIFVMNYFQAAQPALLYIVPAVLGSVFLHAALNGEVRKVWDYSEAVEEEQPPQEAGAAEGDAAAAAGATPAAEGGAPADEPKKDR